MIVLYYNKAMNIRLEEMQITFVDPKSWRFRVGPIGHGGLREAEIDALLLSSVPVGQDGSGFFALPTVGDACTVLFQGTRAYILGFHGRVASSTGGYGGVVHKVGMEEGDTLWFSKVGTLFKASMRGGWHWIVDNWSKLYLGMANQEIRGWFRNIYLRSKGGRVEWESTNDSSQYLSVRTKKFEHDVNNDAREFEPRAPQIPAEGVQLPYYVDKEIDRVGDWGPDQAFKTHEIRAGGQSRGGVPRRRHVSQYVVPNGPEVRHTYSGVLESAVLTLLDVGVGLELTLKSNGANDPYFSAFINNQSVNITHAGDVNISVQGDVTVTSEGNATLNAPGNITIGGEGEEQQLVTKKFVDEVFKTHQHIGNNGAPTSTPINNALILDPVTRSNSNHFTKDTKAE